MPTKIFFEADLLEADGWRGVSTIWAGFDASIIPTGYQVSRNGRGDIMFAIQGVRPADTDRGWVENRGGEFPTNAEDEVWVKAINGDAKIVGSTA